MRPPSRGDTEDQVQALDVGLLIQNTAADGLVRVHNHGSDHLKPDAADAGAPDPLYARFGYSTRPGPRLCTIRPTMTSRCGFDASGALA